MPAVLRCRADRKMIVDANTVLSRMGLLESIYQRMDGNPQLRRIPPPPRSDNEEREMDSNPAELQADNA